MGVFCQIRHRSVPFISTEVEKAKKKEYLRKSKSKTTPPPPPRQKCPFSFY